MSLCFMHLPKNRSVALCCKLLTRSCSLGSSLSRISTGLREPSAKELSSSRCFAKKGVCALRAVCVCVCCFSLSGDTSSVIWTKDAATGLLGCSRMARMDSVRGKI